MVFLINYAFKHPSLYDVQLLTSHTRNNRPINPPQKYICNDICLYIIASAMRYLEATWSLFEYLKVKIDFRAAAYTIHLKTPESLSSASKVFEIASEIRRCQNILSYLHAIKVRWLWKTLIVSLCFKAFNIFTFTTNFASTGYSIISLLHGASMLNIWCNLGCNDLFCVSGQ